MGHDVFISYSSHDKKVADATCALLEQRGYRCWIAPRDILPGQEWGEAIIDGIHDARVFVLIFSGSANESRQVRREVERAVGHGLAVIPFRIENVTPAKSLEYFISNQHWLDALTPPLERHLNHLADTIGRLLGEAPHAPAAPPSASPSAGRSRVGLWVATGIAAVTGLVAVAAMLLFLQPGRPDRPVAAPTATSNLSPSSAQPAPREPSPTPARPAPAPPADDPVAAQRASALYGSWSGIVIEPRSDQQPQYPIAVRIEAGANGAPTGTVSYASFPCTGVWNEASMRGSAWRFRERITDGLEHCAQDVVIQLEPTPGGEFMNILLYPVGLEDLPSRGTLHRAR